MKVISVVVPQNSMSGIQSPKKTASYSLATLKICGRILCKHRDFRGNFRVYIHCVRSALSVTTLVKICSECQIISLQFEFWNCSKSVNENLYLENDFYWSKLWDVPVLSSLVFRPSQVHEKLHSEMYNLKRASMYPSTSCGLNINHVV